MHLKRLRLNNWMAYRGETEIELGPKAYAIVARDADNPDRSNWLGKSALLEAVYFALTGRLNADRHAGAAGWVTDGEKGGGVVLEFDDGLVVSRARRSATRLEVIDGTRTLAKDEAQNYLDQRVGLTADDFLATCYFQQRKMARLILAKPDERMVHVGAWLQLGPLEKAEENVRVRVADLSWRLDTLRKARERVTEIAKAELRGRASLAVLEGELSLLEDHDLPAARGRLASAQDEAERASEAGRLAGVVERYEAIVAEGVALRDALSLQDRNALEHLHRDAAQQLAYATEVETVAARELRMRRPLASGTFDGTCPLAEMACPAADAINAARGRGVSLAAAAQTAYDEACRGRARAGLEERTAAAALQEHDRGCARLNDLRRQVATLQIDYERARGLAPAREPGELRRLLDEAASAVAELTGRATTLRRSVELVSQAAREAALVDAQIASLEADLATHREALVVVGKQGAQRRVAEGVLGRVERGANDLLQIAGIDLGVEVRWSREGAGLARTCDACGHPFPSSARAKTCERCGAPRGAHLINRLEFLLTEQSGAAEDLAGAAIQLAAAAWLRESRGSPWSVALLDEPFGQLDVANRRSLAAHLAALLASRYGFRQALVIAHHASVLDALPGRIEVVREGGRSTARVIS